MAKLKREKGWFNGRTAVVVNRMVFRREDMNCVFYLIVLLAVLAVVFASYPLIEKVLRKLSKQVKRYYESVNNEKTEDADEDERKE